MKNQPDRRTAAIIAQMNTNQLALIAFDGDDTLWHNERYYRDTRLQFREILAKYRVTLTDDAPVDAVEIRNLPYYGYGVMSFILSLIEAGIELTNGRISAEDVQGVLELGKQMLKTDVEVFEQAARVLERAAAHLPLMLITKGEPNHQLAKLRSSGLADYFSQVEVVTEKSAATYREILEKVGLPAERFMMVGNSLRSDILPVIELGGWGVYVPQALTWNHEVVENSANGHDRLFELGDLNELPGLLDRLQNS